MTAGSRLVVATTNPNKLREIRGILDGTGVQVAGLEAFPPLAEPDETGTTFAENARQKAAYYSTALGAVVVAEDSGLEVDGLGGEPGVHSARYAGDSGEREERDARNNDKLIAALASFPDRRAYYYCAMVLVRHAADPQPLIGEGYWWGEIIADARGGNGFGYDPHFFLPELGRTAAELDPEQKNRISHRGQALRQLVDKLRSFP